MAESLKVYVPLKSLLSPCEVPPVKPARATNGTVIPPGVITLIDTSPHQVWVRPVTVTDRSWMPAVTVAAGTVKVRSSGVITGGVAFVASGIEPPDML